ncbi:MAG: hypothetical protein M3Z14_01265 [Candidatus Eremiobacteraeota bacterium]|nr:hypothetical protein [Candidatus Eremiobacteraeota bacterium]
MARLRDDHGVHRRAAGITAARQLLRSLHNTRSMQRNALVSRFFSENKDSRSESEIAERVRALVLEVIDGFRDVAPEDAHSLHAFRQYSILTRYDLARESRHVISIDLGIQTSKFYYERRAALAKFAEELERRTSLLAISQQTSAETFMMHQECALALKEVGRCDLAITLLQSLVNQAPDDARRASALCGLIETLCDTGKTKEAMDALVRARNIACNAKLKGDNFTLLNASVDFAAIRVAWAGGRASEALEIGDRTSPALRSIAQFAEEPRLLLTSLLTMVGDIRTNAGMLSAAVANFNEALATLDTCSDARPALRAMLLSNIAFAQAIMPGGMALARKTNKAALELATTKGLLRNVALGHVNELQFEYWRGKMDLALTHGKLARALTNAMCEPVEQSRVALLYARVEALLGHEQVGLQRVRTARQILPNDSYLCILSHVIESQILRRLAMPEEALAAADRGAQSAERVGSERGRGLAALAMAEAYEAKAMPKMALDALSVAMPALEKSGGLFPLAQALGCSARITGNYRHRADATDLLASFSE